MKWIDDKLYEIQMWDNKTSGIPNNEAIAKSNAITGEITMVTVLAIFAELLLPQITMMTVGLWIIVFYVSLIGNEALATRGYFKKQGS